MGELTTDPTHPDAMRGIDETPRDEAGTYLIAPPARVAKGYIRPYYESYTHAVCGKATTMDAAIAATYASDPWFYGGAYCFHCRMHRLHSEFTWPDKVPLDPNMWEAATSAEVMKAIADRSVERVAANKPEAPKKYWKAVEPPPKPPLVYPTAAHMALDGKHIILTYADGSTDSMLAYAK